MATASSTNLLLLLIVVGYLMIKVWPRTRGFVLLWRARLVPDRYVLAEHPAPCSAQVLLDAAALELQPLGFERQFSYDVCGGDGDFRVDSYAKADQPGTTAIVHASLLPELRPYDVTFHTRFLSTEGEEIALETIGGWLPSIYKERRLHVENLGLAGTPELWEAHQQRITEYESAGHRRIREGKGPNSLGEAERDGREQMENGVREGNFVKNEDGSYHLTAARAWSVQKDARGSIGALGIASLECDHLDESAAMRVEAARCTRKKNLQENATKPGYLILFGISFVAFFLALWIWLGLEITVILTIVIFIHEMGHWIGMKICGYRDARIYFVPMLGGVAMGKKSDPTPTQELIVLLLGPMPGLILGLGAVLAYVVSAAIPYWIFQFGFYAILINYLNLLPVMPLDGGRIVSALFTRRVPRLRFVFSIFSIVAFVVGAITLGSILLGFLALFGLIRLRTEFDTGTIEKDVIPSVESRSLNSDEATLLVVETMKAHPSFQDPPPLGRRITMVNQIVAALGRPKATISAMVAGSFVYALCLAFPVAAALALYAKYRAL